MNRTVQMAVAQTFQFVAILNFLSFFVIAVYLGGDASNGRVVNGHYFLGSHGHYTEVTATVFHYSEVHSSTVLWSALLYFVGVGWSAHLDTIKRRSRLTIRSSGPL
jgi:hypothetical protein